MAGRGEARRIGGGADQPRCGAAERPTACRLSGAAAQMVAIQERIAAKLGAERGIQRKLMLIIQAWSTRARTGGA